MHKWLKQNITITLIVTLLAGYGVGAAFAAVIKSDVERLKNQVDGLPERMVKQEQKLDDALYLLHKIDGYFKYE